VLLQHLFLVKAWNRDSTKNNKRNTFFFYDIIAELELHLTETETGQFSKNSVK